MKMSEIAVRFFKYQELTTEAEKVRLEVCNSLPSTDIYLFCMHFMEKEPRISGWIRSVGIEDTASFHIQENLVLLVNKGIYNELAINEMTTLLQEWLAN